ncbi:hypothetical protein [Sphingobacterium deserti]|uniref:Outer membrane protein beta-barrel domain-containing protein n=1 Tax=Sphingobacterium deserti TaxID=1229276 RepID=A0A0B8T4C5_9SPHI|nr:hypothetical protein [Sphingobacterium deserti]KGE14438.1 hypothetical protein DI53_1865 [Sphingobacterium deserti]
MTATNKIIVGMVFLLISLQSHAQRALEKRNGTFNLNYQFNFTDDSETKNNASSGQSIVVNRSFTIDRLLSLAPAVNYTFLQDYKRAHNFSLGADALLYPLHLISILKEEDYDPVKDKYFMSLGYYKTLNNGGINSIFNMNFYVFTFAIGNQLKISPTIGASFYKQKERDIEDLNFYNIGLNFRF